MNQSDCKEQKKLQVRGELGVLNYRVLNDLSGSNY